MATSTVRRWPVDRPAFLLGTSSGGIVVKVVLVGGSGALGRRIAADLSTRGDAVVVLTRSP